MARNDKGKNVDMNKVRDLSKNIQSSLDNLYSLTYFNTTNNTNDLDQIRQNVDTAIDNIASKNVDDIGTTSITSLYTRLIDAQNDKQNIKAIEDYFGDEYVMNGLINNYTQQRWIRDLDSEIDMVCKYMPKLQEALDTKTDNVLTADSFGRDFIKVTIPKNDKESNQIFDDRIKELKRKYSLLNLLEKSYKNASKYGEQFVYIVPYKKAFAKLLNARQDPSTQMNKSYSISFTREGCIVRDSKDVIISKANIINESTIGEDTIESARKRLSEINDIKVQVDNSCNPIASILEQEKVMLDAKNPNKFTKAIPDETKFDDFKDYDTTSMDGVTDVKKYSEKDFKSTGCIVRRLKRDRVVPIYIEDTCLGYYYFEIDRNNDDYGYADITDPILTVKRSSSAGAVVGQGYENDAEILKAVTASISSMINKDFINTNNDLNKEIYMILKHNNIFNTGLEGLKVIFIPPEDMVHIRFNEDEDTHRGVSDIANGLLAAKLYASIYITNTIGILTRSQDKRVYYVKQTVDTNISQTLLNTINQIKKSNFGLREINSIGQILNITGRYNDYFIPRSQSGDSPIEFEIMPGQNIEPQTELLNMLEEMAVNSTDVPLELIQARQGMDYATQYVMSNSKFLKKVFARQAIVNIFFSDIVTKIYNYEYDEDELITFALPSPMFLQTSNINQLLNTGKEYIQAISEYWIPEDEDPETKRIFNANMLKSIMHSHIDVSEIAKQYELARNENAVNKTKKESE